MLAFPLAPGVILCERGNRTFHRSNRFPLTPDDWPPP
jgi:3-deoxy-D-arabino-heptulosonate 7-phosphate (DAHP) synthase